MFHGCAIIEMFPDPESVPWQKPAKGSTKLKTIRTTGQSAARAEATLAALESRGSAALDSVLPAVRRIVTAVRNVQVRC